MESCSFFPSSLSTLQLNTPRGLLSCRAALLVETTGLARGRRQVVRIRGKGTSERARRKQFGRRASSLGGLFPQACP